MRTGRFTCRSLFLSDIHLGTKDCQADLLIDFLESHNPEQLYLLGDIVDFWSLKRRSHWPPKHTQVLKQIRRMADNGTRVIYIPGNHDGVMRGFPGMAFPNMESHIEFEHTAPDGKRYKLLHGDRFDGLFCSGRILGLVGEISYTLLLKLNRVHNAWLKLRGKPYWSLSAYLKMRPAKARSVIERYEETAAEFAKQEGYDGVICGHIHRPADRTINGIHYLNSGDWVEHCSALVESFDGTIETVISQTPPAVIAKPRAVDVAA